MTTDLSLLKGFEKNFSFEDFHNFHEMCPNGGHELALLLKSVSSNLTLAVCTPKF